MPCNSDYLEPTQFEQKVQRTAQLLEYVISKCELPDDRRTNLIASNIYPLKSDGDYVVSKLCGILSSFDDETMERIVYDAHCKVCRELATWWEEHQEADKKRLEKELQDVKDEEDRKKLLKSMSERDKMLLGIKE